MIDYFGKLRNNYLLPKGSKILLGDKELLRDGFIHLNEEELIERLDELKPSALWVWEENSEAVRGYLTKFLSNVYSLQSIRLCNDYLPLEVLLSANVKAISILDFFNKELLNRYKEFTWSSDHILPNIEFFSFLDFDERYDLGGISPITFPALQWIECYIDKKGKTLDTLRGFAHLTTAHLHYVRKHDVFSALQDLDLKMLKLGGFDQGFSFEKIGEISSLEVLHINGYREYLDLQLIVDLPLKEVYFVNCTRMEHSEVLLQIPTLESIHIIDCKKPLSEEVKEGLKEKFPLADIDFQ
ncbi:hypothetical protein [Paenibacillus durus]|uniref:Leucine-rich repeat domain-containing protein n=1 Tax=Paenibacillus durus TaxID=44251 RepID=A0A089HRR2_PAEDU|nr:hypothetical protein [Paenibacillus durus]AIQ13782.1 hypothetical protein PDUR_19065 [Paenibacillus durus]